jgi:hypothetical protein
LTITMHKPVTTLHSWWATMKVKTISIYDWPTGV